MANGFLLIAPTATISAARLACGQRLKKKGRFDALSQRGLAHPKVQSIAETSVEEENASFPSDEESANFSPEEQKQAGIDGLRSLASIVGDAIKQVDDLKPPQDLQQAHDALVEEGNSLAQGFEDLADQAEDVPPDGIEDFFNTQVFTEATFAPFDQACSALQDLGAQQGVEVDLHCTD